MSALHAVEINNGPAETEPLIFLHGFGGVAAQWRSFQMAFSYKRPTLAFDLPGHGQSANYPNAGPPKVAARAVLEEMDARDISKAHFVGHSMGGAISALIAMLSPERVASLSLLAPGGFGEEFNLPLLKKWAVAKTPDELSAVMPAFFAPTFDLPQKIIEFQAEIRRQPGLTDTLLSIANGMSSDGKQGVLPIDEILAGDYPVSVVWGEEDEVLPVSQARNLSKKADVHILDGVGHSPAEEATEYVKKVIEGTIARVAL